MNNNISEAINELGQFCGMRDVNCLDRVSLSEKYGICRADVFVLFGGSILAGGDVLAQAIKDQIAKVYVIVGGAGHTTETLRQIIHKEYPGIETDGLPEAEIFQRYLKEVYSCEADYLETKSTNCGNNITYLLDLLKENNIKYSSIVLCQDATMQRRMDAGLRKYAPDNLNIINYASYRASVTCGNNDNPVYSEFIHGMWSMERYVNLLMADGCDAHARNTRSRKYTSGISASPHPASQADEGDSTDNDTRVSTDTYAPPSPVSYPYHEWQPYWRDAVRGRVYRASSAQFFRFQCENNAIFRNHKMSIFRIVTCYVTFRCV